MFSHVSMRKANNTMYCWPTASIRHGESLSTAKRVVKAEFEMDIWLFTISQISISNSAFTTLFAVDKLSPCLIDAVGQQYIMLFTLRILT